MFKTTPHKEALSRTEIEPVDFSIGAMTNMRDPAHQVVAILLAREPSTTRQAVMFEDWDEVMDVVATLLQSATNLWGPPPTESDNVTVLEIPLDPRH